MFVVLYFIMIRPQMKRQKETKAMLEALAAGDEVGPAPIQGEAMDLIQVAAQFLNQASRRDIPDADGLICAGREQPLTVTCELL